MDGQWVGGPDETGVTPDGTMQPWLPPSLWNQPPPCARCGAAFAAHLDGRCPLAESRGQSARPRWPRRHPLLTGAILLVALLAGIGVGTVSFSQVSHATGNAKACYAYWQIRDASYAFDYQAATVGWHNLQAAAPRITDPTLSAEVGAFNEELSYADMPDAEISSTAIEADCTALGYNDPG